LSDLDIGQNQWISEPFEYPDTPMDRGKILWEEDFEKFVAEHGEWGRYNDIDGDGIAYRTVAGNRKQGSSYFARGTGHDAFANYSEDPDVWTKGMDRLELKHKTARQYVPDAIVDNVDGATVGIIAYGSTDPAIVEARDLLITEGLKTNYLRLRALPVPETVEKFILETAKIFVVEMNHDGQLRDILSAELPEESTKLVSSTLNNGLSLTAEWIRDDILAKKEN
ncbi:MAG: 2-oxoacid:acceptor oxidoreductase subunit alpha, partial [Anaerolineales bacterium]|nr:2-oxoacid:acceptor oxidoreductase subunit alpha [Anaerolineales bacterium]